MTFNTKPTTVNGGVKMGLFDILNGIAKSIADATKDGDSKLTSEKSASPPQRRTITEERDAKMQADGELLYSIARQELVNNVANDFKSHKGHSSINIDKEYTASLPDQHIEDLLKSVTAEVISDLGIEAYDISAQKTYGDNWQISIFFITKEYLAAKEKQQLDMSHKQQKEDEAKNQINTLTNELTHNMNSILPEHRCTLCGGKGGSIAQDKSNLLWSPQWGGMRRPPDHLYLYGSMIIPCPNTKCENGFVQYQEAPSNIVYKCSCGRPSVGSQLCDVCRNQQEYKLAEEKLKMQRDATTKQEQIERERNRLEQERIMQEYQRLRMQGQYQAAEIWLQQQNRR